MFKKEEERPKKRGGFLPFVIFRMLLSLTMFCLLAFAGYQAFKYFSGTDPLQIDPKALVLSTITSENAAKTFKVIFGSQIPPQVEEKLPFLKAQTPSIIPSDDPTVMPSEQNRILRFAVIADSHNDNQSLQQALMQIEEDQAKFVIGLGDYTDVGTTQELQQAKEVMDSSGLTVYTTAGDHDLWDARDKGRDSILNFNKVFGPSFSSFSDSNIRFVILYNSDNYLGIDDFQMEWLEREVEKISQSKPLKTFVFAHEPFYHPSSDHVMGKTNPDLKDQAKQVMNLFKPINVGAVFAGDTHFFSRYKYFEGNIEMVAVGALTRERNTQSARYLLVDVYDDGSYNILNREVNN